jgi:hypothetical protein
MVIEALATQVPPLEPAKAGARLPDESASSITAPPQETNLKKGSAGMLGVRAG